MFDTLHPIRKKLKPLDTSIPNVVRNNRIKQSIVHWCFDEHWDLETTCRLAVQLGCQSVELVEPKHFPLLKRYGLVCALAPGWYAEGEPFVKGFNTPEHWPVCIEYLKQSIDACAAYGFPNVIAFTGFRNKASDETGLLYCIEGFKKIVGYAEEKGVTICIEILNTRVTDHPQKGHPGYQGDHADFCMEIIRQVGSPRLKLLFDVYHIQIMDGDLIRRIHEYGDAIGHVHVAGVPGRCELDTSQEIYFPAVMQALIDIGYAGYVGQEFILTGNPVQGLVDAIALCDI
jgi:hydroxypyruvate isomerase